MTDLLPHLQSALHRLNAAANFLNSEAFVARVCEAHQRVVREEMSPWVNRAAAAARWFKSESEIDRAAASGVLTRHTAGGTPLFSKSQGDEAIANGTWNTETMKAGNRRKEKLAA